MKINVAIALANRAALAKTNTKNPTTTKIKKVKVSTKSPPASTIAFKVPPNNSCITLPSMRRIRTLQETLLHQKLAAIQQRKMNDDKVVAMALAKRAATSMDNIETLIKTKEKKARIDTDVTATATIVETVPSNSGIILPPLRRGTTVKETTIYQKLAIIQQRKFNDEKVVAMALAKRAATSMVHTKTLSTTKAKKAREDTKVLAKVTATSISTSTTKATVTATATESTSGNSCITLPSMGRGRTLEETAIYLKIAAIQRKENICGYRAKRAALAKTNTKNLTTTKIKKVKESTKSPPASTIAFKLPPNNSCITLPSMRRIRTLQETFLHQKLAAIQQRKMNDDKVVAMALAKRAATSMDNIETLIKTKEKKARIDTDV